MQNCGNNSMPYTGCRPTYPSAPPMPRHFEPSHKMPGMTKPAYEVPCEEMPEPAMPIAMAYVPWQKWGEIYEPEKALKYGTIFKELNLPFMGKGGLWK